MEENVDGEILCASDLVGRIAVGETSTTEGRV